MATDGIKVNMTPSHPGDFIRTEIIKEPRSECDKSSRDSRNSAGNAFGLAVRQRRAITRDGTAHRKGIRRGHGHAAEDAGLV